MEGKLTGLVGLCGEYPMLKRAIGIMIDESPEILNEVDENDDTPLTVACSKENIEMIQLLLEKGANPNYQDNGGRTPLMTIVASCNEKAGQIVELLLANGADPNLRDENGQTALMHAVQNIEEDDLMREIVSFLLSCGADPNIQDFRGMTALMHTVTTCFGNDQIIPTMLIDAGADISIRNKFGRTVFEVAQAYDELKSTLRQAIVDLRNKTAN
jgi:ankyrin repeat protein